MRSKTTTNKQIPVQQVFLIISLFLILLLGAFLRIQYVQKYNFPLNDGGMFFTMIRDLQANHFRLPTTTSYNFSEIPYAYPPISFYEVGALNSFFNVDLLSLFRIYPLLWNLLSIPLFFFLAREVTRGNQFRAVLATGFYAILLSSFEWLIVGGGITRSPAHTLFIAALTAYLIFLRTQARKWFVASFVCAAFMAGHHLEYAWLLAISIFVFSIHRQSWAQFLVRILLYALGVALLTAPYWVTILVNHGLSPFLSAFASGEINFNEIFSRLVALVFTEESLSNYINVLVILAIFFTLGSKQDRKTLFWLVVICIFDNRSAFRALTFPVAVLAAISVDYLRAWLASLALSAGYSQKTISRITAALVVFSVLYPFFLAFLQTLYPHRVLSGLTGDEKTALGWVAEFAPPDSDFIVIDTADAWFDDRLAEWFPALAERHSLNTVQGAEWFGKAAYHRAKQVDAEFRACVQGDQPCADYYPPRPGRPLYVFISADACNPNVDGCVQRLSSIFGSESQITPVFENPAGMVAAVELK